MNRLLEWPELTPEDLARMPDGDFYELDEGRLVERNMSLLSSRVSVRLIARLDSYCETHALGDVFTSDAGYQCFPGLPKTVRKPDVSFVGRGRFPGGQIPTGDSLIAPDLAVEVISPNDEFEKVMAKVELYLSAGVRLIWVISPTARTVLIFRLNGSIGGVRDGGDLDGEDVVPGFRCPVRELFPPSAAPTASTP